LPTGFVDFLTGRFDRKSVSSSSNDKIAGFVVAFDVATG
jgi:hypothetical protein